MHRKIVLLIEEDIVLGKAILRILKPLKLDLLEAEDSKTGLSLAQQYQPDLIICDVLDGLSTLKKLKNSPFTVSIPVLYCSDSSSLAVWQQAIQLGATKFLLKPFTRLEFTETVKYCLGKNDSVAQVSQNKQ